jgi:hypothetical protein
MLSDGKPLDIFEHEVLRPKFADNSKILFHKRIPGIIKRTLAYQRKSLARCPAYNNIDINAGIDSGCQPNLIPCQPKHGSRQYGAVWKVVFVNCGMNRIDFNRRNYVEARLFEAQAQSARTGK